MPATATTFTVPTAAEVSPANQQLFDKLEKGLGIVPNLYATFAHSETALGDYLTLQSRKTSLTLKEKEVVNLVTSAVNECDYCQAAHTVLGQQAGFTEDETIELRRGDYDGDTKLTALAHFVRAVAENRGHITDEDREAIFEAGYNEGQVVDVIIAVGDKIITNYLHNVTEVPVDFPAAPVV